ncbi:TonB-dependent receptor [Sphingomonas populi]|uniref:TonB-dependent receptor n=2 Tax=Sphingomonas populi TaxID=2484750 RepID=A0A4Q6XU86_9SPHN|nr:TonB-dependent receptor [Sphingomonas populi]
MQSASPGRANVAQADGIADIVVTAQKRTERLQDVPLAVTAVGGDALAARQINSTSTLTQAVPSLTFNQGATPTNTSIRIRGVGTQLFGLGTQSSVATVIDGVPQARQAQGFTSFADIERIEVLRGPQGTLFGANASAGVVSVVTARPSGTLEGRGDVTIAEHNEYRAKGTVSGPLTETLRARLTGFYNDAQGTTYNVTTGRFVNGEKNWGVRGKLEWQPTSNLTLLGTVDYRRDTSLCCASTLLSAVTPAVIQLSAPVVASYHNRQITENEETTVRGSQQSYTLQGDLDLGGATITSISAYQRYTLDVNQPIDRINSNPVPFVGRGAPYSAYDLNEGIVKLGQFSQELRVGSNGNRNLTYVAGVFYAHLNLERPFERRRAMCPATAGIIGQPCPVTPIFQSSQSDSTLITDSIAAFGQLEYRVAGGFKLIGGLRVQNERGTNTGYQRTPSANFPGTATLPGQFNASGSKSANDTAVTGKAGAQYEFSRNLQTYATYTRGYKGVGYNTETTTDFANQTILAPEHVNAYEVGLKARTADGKFTLNAAAFLADYTNLQVQANRSDPVTGTSSFITTNAGSSRTKGIELEANIRPSRSFSVAAAFTLADSRINIDGLNCPLQFQAAAAVMTGKPINMCYRTAAGATPIQNLRNAQLPSSPEYRVVVSPRLDQNIGSTGYAAFAQVDMSFQSKQQMALEQDPLLIQKAYALVNASIGFHPIDNRFTATLFVKNVFNTHYFTSLGHNSLLATAANPNDVVGTYNKDADRYIGGSIGFRF